MKQEGFQFSRACPKLLGQLLQFRTASLDQNIHLEVHVRVLVKLPRHLIHAPLNDYESSHTNWCGFCKYENRKSSISLKLF